MKKHVILVFVLVVSLVTVAGCAKKVPTDVYGSSIPHTAKLESNSVAEGIIKAGHELGWAILPSGENTLEATLRVRNHVLVCSIEYSQANYKITYKSSENLRYKNGKIHSSYKRWLTNLQKGIDRELALRTTQNHR